MVHPANIRDRDGGILLLATLFGMYPFLKELFADDAYQGPEFHKALAKALPHLETEIVKRSDQAKGFIVLGLRGVIDHQRKRQSLLVVAGQDQPASQFATNHSESSQGLMRHRRPGPGPTADGGAHGPADGSPSAASVRIVRSDQVRPTASGRGLCPSGADDQNAAMRGQPKQK
jgi:Transposase DDE domain